MFPAEVVLHPGRRTEITDVPHTEAPTVPHRRGQRGYGCSFSHTRGTRAPIRVTIS